MSAVSVIIPVKPPEPHLPYLEEAIREILPGCEILVQKEKGLGNAIRAGVSRSSREILAVLDADGSHDPGLLREACRILNDFPDIELIVGSRYVRTGYSMDSISRKLISLFCTALTRILYRLGVQDPLSGYVVARRRLFVSSSWSSGYKFGLSLLWSLRSSKKAPVLELGYVFRPRLSGDSKANPLTGINFFKDLICIRSSQKCF